MKIWASRVRATVQVLAPTLIRALISDKLLNTVMSQDPCWTDEDTKIWRCCGINEITSGHTLSA